MWSGPSSGSSVTLTTTGKSWKNPPQEERPGLEGKNLSILSKICCYEINYFPIPGSPSPTNGAPKYELQAFISHMGTSTLVGHYVCHIKREGSWVIYNDNKVALSEKPPKGLGYLYLYKRKDA